MERTLSLEDRIKRAEEIYLRRNNKKIQTIPVKENKVATGLLKKITIQTLISALIFTSTFMLLNNERYSATIKEKADEILSYNINFNKLYKQLNIYLTNENTRTTVLQENINEIEELEVPQENTAVLGITESTSEEKNVENEPILDNVEYIKKNISIIKPLNGVITSRFGLRENVKPYNHTGLDIAANTGTVIIAAMDGVAELVSEEGSYGKHIKLVNGEVATLYAHCSKLYIKEGEEVRQGQPIAEVGSTGNATGPHLHFEIMRNNEYINPEDILEF